MEIFVNGKEKLYYLKLVVEIIVNEKVVKVDKKKWFREEVEDFCCLLKNGVKSKKLKVKISNLENK